MPDRATSAEASGASVDVRSASRRENRWCRIENFLPTAEHAVMLEAALVRETEFTASSTTSGDTGHRRSRLLQEIPLPYRDVFVDALQPAWQVAARALGLPRFRL